MALCDEPDWEARLNLSGGGAAAYFGNATGLRRLAAAAATLGAGHTACVIDLAGPIGQAVTVAVLERSAAHERRTHRLRAGRRAAPDPHAPARIHLCRPARPRRTGRHRRCRVGATRHRRRAAGAGPRDRARRGRAVFLGDGRTTGLCTLPWPCSRSGGVRTLRLPSRLRVCGRGTREAGAGASAPTLPTRCQTSQAPSANCTIRSPSAKWSATPSPPPPCRCPPICSATGWTRRPMAEVVVKNRANGVLNQYAQLRKAVTVEEVLASPVISWPVKRMDSSPRSSAAAALVVGPPEAGKRRRRRLRQHRQRSQHGHPHGARRELLPRRLRPRRGGPACLRDGGYHRPRARGRDGRGLCLLRHSRAFEHRGARPRGRRGRRMR